MNVPLYLKHFSSAVVLADDGNCTGKRNSLDEKQRFSADFLETYWALNRIL